MFKVKGLGRGLATYNRDQQCFTISDVAADWHELMTPRRIMRPSIVYDWTRGAALHPVTHELLLISRPAEGRRLGWPEQAVG